MGARLRVFGRGAPETPNGGRAGGLLRQNTGTDVGPQPGGDAERKGNSQPGAGVRKRFDSPLGAPVVLDVPASTSPAPEAALDGHKQVDFSAVHGPVRPWAGAEKPGDGSKTPGAESKMGDRLKRGLD